MKQCNFTPLEERLKNVDNDDVKGRLITELDNPRINPADQKIWSKFPKENGYSYKYAYTDALAEYFKNRGIPFKDHENFRISIYNAQLNKDLIKRIFYGLLSVPNVPKEVLSPLTNWEKLYFFGGAWWKRNTIGLYEKTVPEITGIYIKEGIDGLHKLHHVKKAKGEYSRDIKLPESQFYHRDVREKQISEYKKELELKKKYSPGEQMELWGDLDGDANVKEEA